MVVVRTASKSRRQKRRTNMKIQLVLAPRRTARTMVLGALSDGRGISSTMCVTPSNAVSPNVDCRRPRMKAMPSGH